VKQDIHLNRRIMAGLTR